MEYGRLLVEQMVENALASCSGKTPSNFLRDTMKCTYRFIAQIL